jgi:GNAT superfamily N-acetyltransferase
LENDLFQASAWESHVADPEGHTLVARDGERIVGLVALDHQRPARTLRLWTIFVRPDYRRWGIGTRLLEAAEELGRELGVAWLEAHVDADNPGLTMFLQAGFVVSGLIRRDDETALVFSRRS